MLRDYQQEAVDAAVAYMKRVLKPCLIVAPTGSGKSHIVASLAQWLNEVSGGKRVLCLQPSKELTEQNYQKFVGTGSEASIFSASLGSFSTRHPVVYGTDKTVKNRLQRFLTGEYCGVILDEAHGVTPTIMNIISEMQKASPNLRVVGLTATPYRLGTGYIYAYNPQDNAMIEAKDPYFHKAVYEIEASLLIERGYLTPPVIGDVTKAYDTSGLVTNSMGKYTKDSIDRAYIGKGRLTSSIVADVVERSQRRTGVMFFCATIQHAQEVLESLPPMMSAMVTGQTKADVRASILKRFKAGELKYLANVDVLTTGFDAPNVDTIALLRHTESVGLLQQIVGRGLRIMDGKTECLVLDYAENIKAHCPDGDIFKPRIEVTKGEGGEGTTKAKCPACGYDNWFKPRHPNDFMYMDSEQDMFGYYVGTQVPAHYGRRCRGYGVVKGEPVQCDYRWAGKTCDTCGHENDIAARYCKECKAELVDPNEKLVIEFAKFAKDPYQLHTDKVIGWGAVDTLSKAGRPMWRIEVETPLRQFVYFVLKGKRGEDKLMLATNGDPVKVGLSFGAMPKTITYKKNRESGFYDVFGYNKEEDKDPRALPKLPMEEATLAPDFYELVFGD